MCRCAEQGVTSVFALTRKKLGEIYGARKRVSAVALLELNGVDDLALQASEVLGDVMYLYVVLR